jgi:hypothetical protein
MGRPSDYSQELADEFLNALRLLGFVNKAADYARIDRGKIYRWMRLGETGKEPYASFLADMLHVRADLQLALKTTALQEPKQATWFLERMFPSEYGMREKVEQAAQEQLQQWLDAVIGDLSDSARTELIDAIARHVGGAAEESTAVAGAASEDEGEVVVVNDGIKALPRG